MRISGYLSDTTKKLSSRISPELLQCILLEAPGLHILASSTLAPTRYALETRQSKTLTYSASCYCFLPLPPPSCSLAAHSQLCQPGLRLLFGEEPSSRRPGVKRDARLCRRCWIGEVGRRAVRTTVLESAKTWDCQRRQLMSINGRVKSNQHGT